MKKLAFALMLALPMMFASCSKDDNKEEPYTFSVQEPVLTWGASSDEVKVAVNKQDLGLILSGASKPKALMYVTPASGDWQLPWYEYDFDNSDKLVQSAYYVDTDYTTDLVEYLNKHYTEYAPEEGDTFITYGNAENENDCTMYVYLESYDHLDTDVDGTVLLTTMLATWDPVTAEDAAAFKKTRGMTKRQFSRKQVEERGHHFAL